MHNYNDIYANIVEPRDTQEWTWYRKQQNMTKYIRNSKQLQNRCFPVSNPLYYLKLICKKKKNEEENDERLKMNMVILFENIFIISSHKIVLIEDSLSTLKGQWSI